MLIVNIIENKTMHTVFKNCVRICFERSCTRSNFFHLVEFISSIFSVHSSTNLFTNLFLRLQILYSKYSLKSQDL